MRINWKLKEMSSLSPLGSNYNRSVFVSTCVGAAICAGLYVIWGPEHFFRKKGSLECCSGISNTRSQSIVIYHYNLLLLPFRNACREMSRPAQSRKFLLHKQYSTGMAPRGYTKVVQI